jgi:hypothetical protein
MGRVILLSAFVVSLISSATTSQELPAGPVWALSDNQRFVTVTFPTNPGVAIRFDVLNVEDMLANLGRFRAAMWPNVPATQPLGQAVEAITSPGWATEPEARQGDTLFHIRDPRFGWLHYVIPREEARRLADSIQHQVNAPPPPPKVD